METPSEPEPIYRTMSDEALRKLFEDTKSNDLTQSQFEQEKTKRICALSEALKSVANCESPGYGRNSPRDDITSQLLGICQSQYSSAQTRFLP